MSVIIIILIGLFVTAIVLYLINTYLTDLRLRQILTVFILLALVIWLLNFYFKFM